MDVLNEVTVRVTPLGPEDFPNTHEVYIADCIIKHRQKKGRIQYLVKWKGWANRYNTWEPEEHILDFQLIRLFEQKRKLRNERAQKKKLTNKSAGHMPVYRKNNHHEYDAISKTRLNIASVEKKSLNGLSPDLELNNLVSNRNVTKNVFRLMKFKRLPHHLPRFLENKQRNEFAGVHLPPLDCLRSIKFKLGWHYAQIHQAQGLVSGLERMTQYSMRGDINISSDEIQSSPTSLIISKASDSGLSLNSQSNPVLNSVPPHDFF